MTRLRAIPALTLVALASVVAVASPPTAAAAPPGPGPHGAPAAVTLGVDVLLSERIDLVAGRRVGLVTHAAAVDGALVATVDRLAADPRVRLVQLYAPEHGLRGVRAAGERLVDEVDAATGLPVEGLFGRRTRPTATSLARVDVVVVDLQDIGSRTYTFASTLGEVMTAAAAARVPVVVLDRPNPLGGLLFEGPVREAKRKSFLGWGPLPVTHGLTMGELARLYDAELALGCDVTVVSMRGWRRDMTWEETGLAWVPTSPGIPHVESARLYVATGMFAGVSTNVNEGVGTTQPFEFLGAGFIAGPALVRELEASALPGVRWRPAQWRPYYHAFRGQTLAGVQLVVTAPRTFRPLRTALTLMVAVERLYPGVATFRSTAYVGRIWGTDVVLPMIRAGRSVAEIEASWAEPLARFATTRERHLLYR